MKEQLTHYVELLFAGAEGAEDMKQEILQNTLDRYDDLLDQGKTPEAAYRLAISGIGDINELLSGVPVTETAAPTASTVVSGISDGLSKILRAAAIALYIICPIPLFILSELNMATIGLCGTLGIVAVATVLLLLGRRKTDRAARHTRQPETLSPREELRKSIRTIISTIGLVLYLVLSFLTQAWYITWVIFPLMGAINGLVTAIMDLKEDTNHET